MDFSVLLSADAIIALISLTFLEIVLGIDNIIFISIASNKLEEAERKKATNIGLILAMLMRIALLFGLTALTAMNAVILEIDWGWFKVDVTGQAVVLLVGGLFLIYKSTKEIHEKVEHKGEEELVVKKKATSTLSKVILQITIINVVFSFDSILTAIGMTNGIAGALLIMIISIILSVAVMMIFAVPVGKFVSKHPTVQILALSFLILIGLMLILESAHLSHANVFGNVVGAIPKGYLYFAIIFAVVVEFLNMKLRKKKKVG